MINLAEIHLVMGNISKAEEIAEYIRTLGGDNEKLLLLEEAIANRTIA